MKKLLSLLLVFILALTAAMFAACAQNAEDGGAQNGGAQNGGAQNGGAQNGNTQIDANTDPDTIVSDQMTETEWTAAFAADSFKNYTMLGVMSQSTEQEVYSSKMTLKYVETDSSTILHTLLKDTFGTEVDTGEGYYEKTASTIYQYSQIDGAWIKREALYLPTEDTDMYRNIISGEFGKLQYDNAAKAYTATNYALSWGEGSNAKEFSLNSVTVKFANKKLAYIEYVIPTQSNVEQGSDNAPQESTMTVSLKYYDYGTTQVTLPQASSVDEGGNGEADLQVSEAEWLEAFSAANLSNFVVNGEMRSEVTIEIDGVATPVSSSGTLLQKYDISDDHDYRYMLQTSTTDQGTQEVEVFTSKENGVTTIYGKNGDGTWSTSTYEGDFISLDAFYDFAELYSEAEYDSATGNYVISDYAPAGNDGPMFNSIYLRFDNSGKCVFVQMVIENGLISSGTTGDMTITYNLTYGTASITLPEIQ